MDGLKRCKMHCTMAGQTDPVLEARNFLHTANLDRDKNYAAFANKFQQNLAVVQSGEEDTRMSPVDQIFCFRKALMNTSFHRETEVDPSTHRPFTSLTAMMDRCRTIYQGRFPNGPTDENQVRGMNPQRSERYQGGTRGRGGSPGYGFRGGYRGRDNRGGPSFAYQNRNQMGGSHYYEQGK